jgi:Protein of unknown function (DUF3105)
MPKSKTRKNRKSPSGHGLKAGKTSSPAQRRRNRAIIVVSVAIAAVAIGVFWWNSAETEGEFLALAEQGKASLSKVRNEPSRGGGHLALGQTRSYRSRFPTSGSHHRVPTVPGFYDSPQLPTQLVHSMEHGHVVIYYDKPGAGVLEDLRDFTRLYSGNWSGVVVTRMPGLGSRVVLTAWRKRIEQPKFDKPAAAAFIDAFRGRGPEKRVR